MKAVRTLLTDVVDVTLGFSTQRMRESREAAERAKKPTTIVPVVRQDVRANEPGHALNVMDPLCKR